MCWRSPSHCGRSERTFVDLQVHCHISCGVGIIFSPGLKQQCWDAPSGGRIPVICLHCANRRAREWLALSICHGRLCGVTQPRVLRVSGPHPSGSLPSTPALLQVHWSPSLTGALQCDIPNMRVRRGRSITAPGGPHQLPCRASRWCECTREGPHVLWRPSCLWVQH